MVEHCYYSNPIFANLIISDNTARNVGGRMRDECLNVNLFNSLLEARTVIAEWTEDYNKSRPHSSLGYLTPEKFRLTFEKKVKEINTLKVA